MRAWFVMLLGLALAWACFLTELDWLAIPLLLGFAGVAAVRQRWAELLLFMGLSPVGVPAMLAVVSYARGTAHLMTIGYPSLQTRNVDRETRFQYVTSGCTPSAAKLLWHLGNDSALRALAAVFGPMPGAYDGPVPSAEQTAAALGTAETIAWNEIRTDLVPLRTGPVRLRPGLGAGLFTGLKSSDPARPRAVLWAGRVLILELPLVDHEGNRSFSAHVTIDAASGRVIAYESERALGYGRFPRQWS